MSCTHPVLEAFLDRRVDGIVHAGIEFFVFAPRTMEWAAAVRRRLWAHPPAAVAAALPETLRPVVMQALSVLPAMGLVTLGQVPPPLTDPILPVESVDACWEALRTAVELHIPWRVVAPDDGEAAPLTPPAYDGAWLSAVPPEEMMRCELGGIQASKTGWVDESTASIVAFHLQRMVQAASGSGPVVFVCPPAFVNPVLFALDAPAFSAPLRRTRRESIAVHQASEELAQAAGAELMGFVRLYEQWRQTPEKPLPSRYQMTHALLLQAVERYNAEFSTQLPLSFLKTMLRYMRNLALTQNRLFPSRMDLILAARSFYDQHFGWFFYQEATSALPPTGAAPILDLSPEDLQLDMRTITFAMRMRQQIPAFLAVSPERRERQHDAWKKAFDEALMCSYPPEDVYIEGSVRHFKQRGESLIGERTQRSFPFSGTLLDGLDLRETLRHWHEKRLWVREETAFRGKVGSVVIIFDEDDEDPEKYPYCAHWHGEHNQESDMAFYATNPEDHVVGPGICRCEYGGLLMTTPPGRMWPVWEDPMLRRLGSKSQLLLAAGLQLTLQPVVLYMAPRPPKPYFKMLAARMGLKLLFEPIGMLSPERIRKLRSFHILAGHKVRSWAHRFIPPQ